MPILCLPFFENFTPKLNPILKSKFYIKSENSLNHKFRNIIRLGKDPIDKLENVGIIYKISCNDCNAVYIGQSGRQLKKRISEHKYYIKVGNENSALVEHINVSDHSFNFTNVKILDRENNRTKREFLEMLHIHTHNNNINRKQDILFLKNTYKTALNKFKL